MGDVGIASRVPRSDGVLSLGAHAASQGEREGRALSELARERDRPLEHAREAPADREPEARPAVLPRLRAVHLLEVLEDARPVLLGDADARVGDGDLDAVVLAVPGRPDADRALLGELEGVVEQVEDDLLDL